MVAQEEELEEEEAMATPGAPAAGAGAGAGGGAGAGRRLLVAMKLNTSCREMLTWTIAKLAQPGDHILALHVSHLQQGATTEDEASHAQQLANTLRGVISVYESLCNLKQIKLQLEIVSGRKVRNVLVDVASSYEACKLILGTNKSFSVGRTKALGRYCLNRLPCTCTVVILEQGDIIFNKKGRLGADMTRLDMIKVFRRSMRIGRSKKAKPEEEENPSKKKSLQKNFSDVPNSTDAMSFGSCSPALQEDYSNYNSPVSVLPQEPRRNSTSGFEALRISFSKRRAKARLAGEVDQRSDMFLLDDHSSSSPSYEDAQDDDALGWPLLNNTIGFEKPPKTLASIVKWALELPKEEVEMKKTRVLDLDLSLTQEVESLCSDRECAAFAYEVLEAATSRFSQENVVGRGGGSEVFKGTMSDGKLVAVKRLKQSPQAEEELLIDIEINTSLSHAHIVSLLGYCVERSHMLLVYEYLPQGNLEDHLHPLGKEAGVLAWEARYKVAVGVARALEYLHKGCAKPVVHRDVKTSNILLTAGFDSQLSDFGLAKWAPTKASHLLCNDVVGTFGYLAPEYFMYGRVNDRTDVYAFGVVLLELMTGRKPIDTTRPKGEENLVNWARPLLVERALDRLVDPLLGVYDVAQMNSMLIAAFLSIQQSAQRRPQMSQILRVLSGDHESTCLRPEEQTPTLDAEEVDTSYGCRSDETSNNIRSHLALAMMGVDDDSTSQCSVVDLPHSDKYLEEYLEGRFSRSTSFEDQS